MCLIIVMTFTFIQIILQNSFACSFDHMLLSTTLQKWYSKYQCREVYSYNTYQIQLLYIMTSPTIIPHVVLGHECQLSHFDIFIWLHIILSVYWDSLWYIWLKAFVYFMTKIKYYSQIKHLCTLWHACMNSNDFR